VYQAAPRESGVSDEAQNREIAAIRRAARGPNRDPASYVRSLAQALRDSATTMLHGFEIERLLDELP
jgi:cation transport regulator ChaC